MRLLHLLEQLGQALLRVEQRIKPMMRAGRLVPLLPALLLRPFGMVCVVYGERRLPLRTRLFLDLLQDSIGSPPVWARDLI